MLYCLHNDTGKVVRGMNITVFAQNGEVFACHELVSGYSFNNAIAGVKSALLPIITANYALLQDSCNHFYRIECLMPQSCTA